jgi:rod shape-determining protein MreD
VIWRSSVVIGTVMLLAVLIELTVLSRLGLPGATPDLVVVCVVALALALGPAPGAVAGFVGGILLGLAPPSDSVLGVSALVFVLIGFLAGKVVDPRDRSIWIIMGIVGLSASGAVLGTAVLSAILGSDRVVWDVVPGLALSSALYGVLLTPLVVPLIGSVARTLVSELAT